MMEWLYFFLSISIGVTSTYFHFLEISESSFFQKFQIFDRGLSFICYVYMTYFSYNFLSIYYQIFAYTILIISIVLYILSKVEKNKSKEKYLHSYFHFIISSIAAIIVLLK